MSIASIEENPSNRYLSIFKVPSLREKASVLSYPIAHERKCQQREQHGCTLIKIRPLKINGNDCFECWGGSCFTAAICTKIWSNYNIREKLGKVTQPSLENSTSPGLNETIT